MESKQFTLEWLKRLSTRLRRRLTFSRGLVADPLVGERLAPQAIVEQQRAARKYSAATPAAEWTEDITKSNAQIAAEYAAELDRRTALQDRGEYKPRFGSPEADLAFEMRTANVTGLEPLALALTLDEFEDYRVIGSLSAEVDRYELGKMDRTVTMPPRPTKREILDAAGGNEQRAQQLAEKVTELYGPE